MKTGFTWDAEKAARNAKAHGISFATAVEVFSDPNHVVTENYHFEDEEEPRYHVIGMTKGLKLVVVVFVDRSRPGIEILHIISARKAVAYEESIYEDQLDQNQ